MNKVALVYTALGLIMIPFLMVKAYREHKVHNIVLYPDKHSWCKTTTIKQVISYPGCTSVEIDNNVCVGACFSYSIPHTEPSDPGEVIVPYCDSCQPSETTWHQITLQCNKNDADTPSQLIKHVQIIQNCSCTPCEKDSLRLTKFPENNDELLLQQNVDTELLDAIYTRNESNFNHLDSDRWQKMHTVLNQKLIGLLQSIQTNNTDHDKEQLFELFNVIHEPMKHKVKAKDIIEFIETLQNNNKTELDTERLTELLLKFEHSKHHKLEKDPNVNQEEQPIVDEAAGLDAKKDAPQKHSIPSSLPIAVWVQSPPASSGEVVDLQPHVHEHRSLQDVSDSLPEEDPASEHTVVGEEVLTHHHVHPHSHTHPHPHPHPHQHHVNDNVAAHGHLTRGPHGALVIEPDRIHEKLDVNAHELKPNHAGTLLSYHSHSGEGNAHK